MSDAPVDGWWRASNGRWYPPETHPDLHTDGPIEPPAGWELGPDGEWHPPVDAAAGITMGTAPKAIRFSGDASERSRRRWPAVAAAGVGVIVATIGVGTLVVTAMDDDVPVRVDSETMVRPSLPPETIVSSDSTTTTVPAPTTTVAPA